MKPFASLSVVFAIAIAAVARADAPLLIAQPATPMERTNGWFDYLVVDQQLNRVRRGNAGNDGLAMVDLKNGALLKRVSTGPSRGVAVDSQDAKYFVGTVDNAVAVVDSRSMTLKDKIALPAVKLTGHAIALEIEAAKIWGQDHYDKLDAITITRSHADAAAAVMGGGSEINSHFASSPFYYYELATPGIHQVLKSYDALGARHTNGVLVTSKKFHDANPKMCAVVIKAFEEANAFIKAHPREAAQIYLTATKDKNSLDALEKMVADPDVDCTTTPVSVMKIVDFMHKVGRIKKKPDSWKDMFFPEAHGLNGS